MGDRQVTLKDVAEKAGVSTAVVSAAISGGTNNIRMSEATRERVERAIAETGYRVNHAAKSLSMSRSGVIAAVVPKIANPVFEFAIRGMHAAAEENGDVLMLADALWIEPGSQLMSRMAGTGMVDGFLVRSTHWGTETITELISRRIPFVILQTPVPRGHTSVWVDDVAGIATAAEHLLELGHRRVAMVGGPESATLGGPRVEGYLQALRAYGVPVEPPLVRPCGYDADIVGREVHALLGSEAPPTALIVDNIMVAQNAVAAVLDAGVRVPDDLSIVVYQDLPFADAMRPALTTVRMPLYEAGMRGYRTLRRMIDGARVRSAVVSTPRPRLIDRGSTASPHR